MKKVGKFLLVCKWKIRKVRNSESLKSLKVFSRKSFFSPMLLETTAHKKLGISEIFRAFLQTNYLNSVLAKLLLDIWEITYLMTFLAQSIISLTKKS